MYGTVAQLRITPGKEARFIAWQQQFAAQNVAGFVTSYLYRMDADPHAYFLAVVFESKETYDANAESPEQDARYQQMLNHLDGPPEWHDGAIILKS